MGAGLAAPWPDPFDGGLFHPAQFARRPLPESPRALCPSGDVGRDQKEIWQAYLDNLAAKGLSRDP
jgi:hypothetical protein